jgi:hypothetical protein
MQKHALHIETSVVSIQYIVEIIPRTSYRKRQYSTYELRT